LISYLSQAAQEVLVLVQLRIEFELKALLGGLYQEIANDFWHCVPDAPHNQSEVSLNSHPDFPHEHVCAFLGLLPLGRLLPRLAWLVLLRGLVIFLRNNISPVLKVVSVIGEKVLLLCVNDCFN